MKRIAALLALCLLSGTFLRAQGDAYAFFTSSYRATVGFMDLEDPSSFATVPGALDQTSFVLAAEEAEGRVYAYTGLSFFNMVMPGAFSAVSLGEDAYYDEILAVYNTMDYLYYDMAYDRQAGRMYAIAGLRTDNLHWGSYLLEVDISEGDSCGNFRVLGRFAEDLCALDADEDGHVYGIGLSGMFYYVDPATAALTEVGPTGVLPSMTFQNMAFNPNDGFLYWSTVEQGGVPALYRVDALSGEASLVGAYPAGYDFVNALTIPFGGLSSVPGRLAGLSCQTEASQVVLSWTNPAEDEGGQALASLSKVEIFRDGQLVAAVEDGLAAGEACQHALENQPDGLHYYGVRACNADGNGRFSLVRCVVGYDVPAAVGNLQARAEDGTVSLSWDAPAGGKFGGRIDESSLQYRVVRYPDTVEWVIGESSFTDEGITVLDNYSYAVIPFTQHGQGPATRTGNMMVGEPHQGYFACDFSDARSWTPWTVIDANEDYAAWAYGEYLGKPGAVFQTGTNTADDWLVLPPVELEAGTSYMLRYEVGTLYFEFEEKLEIRLGNAPTVDALSRTLGTSSVLIDDPRSSNQSFTVDQSGVYYLAFRVVSEAPESAGLFISDVVLQPSLEMDVAVWDVDCPDYLKAGEETVVRTTIRNTGLNRSNSYSLSLVDAAGRVLASQNGLTLLNAGQESTVRLSYTPDQAGMQELRVVAGMEGDLLAANDSSFRIPVQVMESCGDYMPGTAGTMRQNGIPFSFAASSSASQIVYVAGEIGMEPGVVRRISLEYENANGMTETRPFRLYMANTDLSTLTGGWVPEEDFSLVFDDTVVFERFRNKVTLELDSTFVYDGGNLCLMAVAPVHSQFFGSFHYWVGYQRPGAARYWVYQDGESSYEFDFSQTGIISDNVPSISLWADHCAGAALSGTVTAALGGQPMEGVRVEILGKGISAVTGADGKWDMPYVPFADTVAVAFTCYAYADTVVVMDDFDADRVVDVALSPREKFVLEGVLEDADGMPVASAQVRLTGYDTCMAYSDAQGRFSFSAYQGSGYVLEAFKPRFELYVADSVNLDGALDLGEIRMQDALLAPSDLLAVPQPDGRMRLSWNRPDGNEVFRYDNGVPNLFYGDDAATDKTVLGTVFRRPALLRSMSWMTMEYQDIRHETVNVFVFDLDKDGQPTSRLLYSKYGVPNTDSAWTTHVFDTLVSAPNGFMVGLSYYEDGEGYLAIANDLHTAGSDPDYPFVPGTQYYTADYTRGQFSTLESMDATFTNTMLIRAEGEVTGLYGFEADEESSSRLSAMEQLSEKGAMPKSAQSYAVYRMGYGQEEAGTAWIDLGSCPASDTLWVDEAFAGLDRGLYRYGLRMVYSGGRMSEAALSNLAAKDMDVELTLEVSTNIEGRSAQGAKVSLQSLDYPEAAYRVDWPALSAVDTVIIEGSYALSIDLAGFHSVRDTVEAVHGQALRLSYVLEEIVCVPESLQVSKDASGNYVFTWEDGCGASKALQAYRVYLDDQFKAETGELSYSFGPLPDGWHTAGVEAVFESGSSRRALLDFQAGDVAVESAGQAGVRVSPNPATSFLSLEGDYEECVVLDMNGRVRQVLPAGVKELEVSAWESGMYLFRFLLPDGRMETLRVIVR